MHSCKLCNVIFVDILEDNKKFILFYIGHCVANLTSGEEAVCRGASFITHLFNAMSPFHHRDPGIVGVLTSMITPKQAFYGLISDGVHTHPTALRIAHRSHPKGPKYFYLIMASFVIYLMF